MKRIIAGLAAFHLLTLAITVAAQEVDTTMHIKSIYFGGGSHYIEIEQTEGLYEWLDSFPNIEQYEIIIHSHTDNIGGVEFNQRLSERRSNSVLSLLLTYPAITPDAIEIKDFGMFLPTYANDSYLGRLRNRRADVILKPISL